MRPLLALFVRALRQTTRAPSTYLLRGAIALGVLFALWAAHDLKKWFGAPGQLFFTILMGGNYVMLSLVALGSFTSAITEEKEEDSLGLLRMTNLNPLAILLGKSTSRLGAVLLLVAVQVPFAFLAVTMGGISKDQVLTGYALLSSYLFLLANIALFFSVVSRTSGFAAALTFAFALGVTFLCVFPDWLADVLRDEFDYPATSEMVMALEHTHAWLMSTHPMTHLQQMGMGTFGKVELVRSLAVQLLGGAGFFGLALLAFNRFCGTEAAYKGAAISRQSRRRTAGRAGERAVTWKDFHFTMGGMRGLLLRVVLYVGGAVVFAYAADRASWRANPWESIAEMAWGWGWFLFAVELGFACLLMWGPEVWGQHLGSLSITTMSLKSITLQKLRAMVKMLVPSLTLLSTALFVGSSNFREFHLFVPLVEVGSFSATVSTTLFAALLVVNLSMRLKWAALPTALGVTLVTEALSDIAWSFSGLRYQDREFFRTALYAFLSVVVFINTRSLLLRRAAEA